MTQSHPSLLDCDIKVETCPHLFNASFTQLQHRQVVVSLCVVVIEGQSQFETLVGQRQVSDALQRQRHLDRVHCCIKTESLFFII